jgi:hypothetical protein
MSASDEIRHTARLLGWEGYETALREDVFIRGEQRIYVHYGRDGTVIEGRKVAAQTFRPGSEHLIAVTASRHKKARVLSWLVEAA